MKPKPFSLLNHLTVPCAMVMLSLVGAVLAAHTLCVVGSLRVTALDEPKGDKRNCNKSCVAHRAEEGTADNL
jgi:hypothetical protein